MRKQWYWIAPLAIVGIFVFVLVGGEVVMRLWNWLLPPLFGWRMLTFWQALGLLALRSTMFAVVASGGAGLSIEELKEDGSTGEPTAFPFASASWKVLVPVWAVEPSIAVG